MAQRRQLQLLFPAQGGSPEHCRFDLIWHTGLTFTSSSSIEPNNTISGVGNGRTQSTEYHLFRARTHDHVRSPLGLFPRSESTDNLSASWSAAASGSGSLGPGSFGGGGSSQYAGFVSDASDSREHTSDAHRLPLFVDDLRRLPTMKIKSVFSPSFFSSLFTE